MLQAVRYARMYTSGYASLANKSYKVAYQKFLECYQILGSKKSQFSRFFPLDIMIAEASFQIGKFNVAVEKLADAKSKILENKKLSKIDQKYLISYCNYLLEKWGVQDDSSPDHITKGEIPLVRRKFLSRFPLKL